MKYNPDIHRRRSIRLKGYDYSQPGAYFVTMVTRHRECLFGEIFAGRMELNETGKMIEAVWGRIPAHFHTTRLDEFIIMPNHFLGILWILSTGEASAEEQYSEPIFQSEVYGDPKFPALQADASPQPPRGTNPGSLNAIIQNFKSISTRKINQAFNTPGNKIWQRDYFERVIRNERELNAIRQYIQDNPLKWERDRENPTISYS